MISVHKSKTVQCLTMLKQPAFLSEGFFRRPGHLPNIPEGWNNMMKKAAKVWRKILKENKEIPEKGETRK